MTEQIENLFNEAVAGNLTGKSIAIGVLTKEGKGYLEKLSGLKFKDKVSFTLNPSDLVHIHNDHFEGNEKDKGNNIPLTTLDIKRIVDVISFPTAIMYGKEKNSGRNLFYFLMDTGAGTYNLLEVYSDRKGNLSTKTYYKTKKDAAQRVMELKSSLLPTSETYSGAILSDTKIPQIFELPKISAKYSLSAPTFYSNAEYAVRNIKQEKATPEQWLKMIEKAGGLKAGEDKWLGLSDWLKASDKKTLTKDEVLQYIADNNFVIEEVEYADVADISREEIYESSEFEALRESLTEYDDEDNPYINRERYEDLRSEYPDFVDGFSLDYWGEELEIDSPAAAATYLGLIKADKEIHGTRLKYTTAGLENKREIALVVPSIEPYNQNDEIHFGDAGEGRAVAWIRFGETEVPKNVPMHLRVDAFDAPFKNVAGYDVYAPEGRGGKFSKDYVIYGKLKDGSEAYIAYIGTKPISKHETLEEARNAMNEYYEANPRMITRYERVLVIDEIQSKRHQDGREKGYSDKRVSQQELYEAQEAAFSKVIDYESALADKYGEDEWASLASIEEMAEYERLRALDEAATNAYENYDKGVPSAPFEKNWVELAMKRMLRYAAENGYDKVAWTTGEQQADRYNIGNVVSRILSYPFEGKTKVVINLQNDSPLKMTVNSEGVVEKSNNGTEGQSLADVVGKELANKIMNGEGETATVYDGGDIEAKEISGDGLRIGGEGMKAFYDQILPSFMNKYGKKWGVKVGEVTMPNLEENNTMHSVDVTNAMRDSVMQGQPRYSLPTELLTDYADEFKALQEEYDSLDPATIDYKHPFRVRKREVVQKYADHVTEVLGLPCEIFVIDATDADQVKDAYDRYKQSHQSVSQKDPKRATKLASFDKFESWLKNDDGGYAVGLYFHGTDFIVMNISDGDNYNEQNGYLQVCLHENVHGAMDALGITDFEKKAVLAEGLKHQPNAVKKTLEGYENEDDATKGEELIAFAINTRLESRYGTLLLEYFEGRASKDDIWKSYNLQLPLRLSLTGKILNYLKDEYDRKQNSGNASGDTGGNTATNRQKAKRLRSGHFEENHRDEQRGNGSIADTSYSLPSIPFYDEQGNVIDMREISEAKVLEMVDGRVRSMIEHDYNNSVVAIAKDAKDARRATRAYYAEERRKRRGKKEAPRTNAAKIDELFADTDINSLPLEVQALIFIAEGRAKIRWADKDGKKGLASELGLANSASDKAAMKSVWTGAEQSFDEVVHGWWESINGYERGIDTQDLRNAV